MTIGLSVKNKRESVFERRLRLLTSHPAFALFPQPVLAELAGSMHEETFERGRAVVVEGDLGDRLYLIAAGRAEVTTAGPEAPVILATLEAGEMFGELALLTASGRRQATVTALTSLVTLSLNAESFERAINVSPGTAALLVAAAEEMLTAKFLKLASPFVALDGAQLRKLAARLKLRSVAAGDVIVRQGETGNACYLVRRGTVEVVTGLDPPSSAGSAGTRGPTNSGQVESPFYPERRLATLGPGMLFGEAALLTDAPRNATVRALAPVELLVLSRTDLLEVMGEDRRVGAYLIELLRLRARPRAADGVLAEHCTTAEGNPITILREPRRGLYYRLSPEGWFLWQRLDGRHTFRDLTLDHLATFKRFAPQAVADLVGDLAATGFVECRGLRSDVMKIGSSMKRWQWLISLARRILEWRVPINGVDAAITRFYTGGVRLLYTRTGLWIMTLITLAGLISFGLHGKQAWDTLQAPENGTLWLWLIPVIPVMIVCHEAGHAFTTKACGRQVLRLGFGWYWHGPVFYVDTSDMWPAPRGQRIAVDCAGVGANVLTGGMAALALWLPISPTLAAWLYLFALASYLEVLLSFNPLLEYDGYHVLSDWLDRPGLRQHALTWLGTNWLTVLRRPRAARGHCLELVYGLGSLAYVILLAALTMLLYRSTVEGWLDHLLPAGLSDVLAWVLPATAILVFIAATVGDLRGLPKTPRS